MPNNKPVLVVHGIANHDEAAFRQTVKDLQANLGAGHRLIEVFWGDLGGIAKGLADTLPALFPADDALRGEAPATGDEEFLRLLTGQRQALMEDGEATRTLHAGSAAADELYWATVSELEAGHAVEPGFRALRGSEDDELKDALRDALQTTTHLQALRDPALQQAAARLLADYLKTGAQGAVDAESPGELVTRGLFSDAQDAVRSFVKKIDDLIGATSASVAGAANRWVRGKLAGPIALTLGDIVAYHQRRAEIHARLFSVLDEHAPGHGTPQQPITVLAHSLGGLVTFDAAIGSDLIAPEGERRRLHIDHWVTFGSQPAFFHVLAPREGIARYASGRPVPLPATISRWTNLWHPLDVLAFTAGEVFRLANGSRPTDRRVDTSGSEIVDSHAWLHSCYWRHAALVDAALST